MTQTVCPLVRTVPPIFSAPRFVVCIAMELCVLFPREHQAPLTAHLDPSHQAHPDSVTITYSWEPSLGGLFLSPDKNPDPPLHALLFYFPIFKKYLLLLGTPLSCLGSSTRSAFCPPAAGSSAPSPSYRRPCFDVFKGKRFF